MMVCVHSKMSARKKAGLERRRFVAWCGPFAKMMPVLPHACHWYNRAGLWSAVPYSNVYIQHQLFIYLRHGAGDEAVDVGVVPGQQHLPCQLR